MFGFGDLKRKKRKEKKRKEGKENTNGECHLGAVGVERQPVIVVGFSRQEDKTVCTLRQSRQICFWSAAARVAMRLGVL